MIVPINTMRSNTMGFEENRPHKPFYGFVMIYRYFRQRWLNRQTARTLQGLSKEQLRDIGLTTDDISHWK
ncbi:DUF1127 domain-containing protein [Buttiauxella brennerae]